MRLLGAVLLAATADWYAVCEQAGFMLRADSPAIVANNPDLHPFDENGEPIAYIGACPPARTSAPPAAPTEFRLSTVLNTSSHRAAANKEP
jgi:hypothetical protein